MTISSLTKLSQSSNESIEAPPFISTLQKMPFELLKNIYVYLQPNDLVNFLCTSSTIREIDNLYKEAHPVSYRDLVTQIHFNFLNSKSIEQLSTDMIDLCSRDKREKLKLLFKFLIIYKKFKHFFRTYCRKWSFRYFGNNH